MMPDYVVKPGETAILGRIDGDLRVGRNATILSELGNEIVVTGIAVLEAPVKIRSNFVCGSLTVEGRGYRPGSNTSIVGDLTVQGDADVASSLEVTGNLRAANLDVAGHLKSRSVTSKVIRVGGHIEVESDLEGESLAVGGHMSVGGIVKLGSLHVGGHAKIGGGEISGEIKVMGHLTTRSKLMFGELDVLGQLELPGGSSGQRLLASGVVNFLGDASCKILQVKGVVSVSGSCEAEEVDVTGVLRVAGFLSVSKGLRIYGATEVGQRARCYQLILGGRLKADSVLVDEEADIGGEVHSSRGLKGRSIVARKGSRISGPIVGDNIEIGRAAMIGAPPWAFVGKKTTVDNLHGGVVRIGPPSRVQSVFAEVVELDEGSIVKEVTYTKELRMPAGYRLPSHPRKVEKLPEPPL